MRIALALAPAVVLAAWPTAGADTAVAPALSTERISLEEQPDRVVVTVDSEPFTEYRFQQEGLRRPVLFPLHGPHGLTLTRSWPVGPRAPGDPEDHPHHESFWFAHGDVNGHDFWAPRRGERIEQTSLDHVGDGRIEATSRWLAPDGSVVCTDRRVLAFAAEGDDRIIDHAITITASHGPLVFGDTKEGTMALRVRPELNLKQAKGGPPATGQYLNDSGDRDAAAWGKPAASTTRQTSGIRPAGTPATMDSSPPTPSASTTSPPQPREQAASNSPRAGASRSGIAGSSTPATPRRRRSPIATPPGPLNNRPAQFPRLAPLGPGYREPLSTRPGSLLLAQLGLHDAHERAAPCPLASDFPPIQAPGPLPGPTRNSVLVDVPAARAKYQPFIAVPPRPVEPPSKTGPAVSATS